jgi:hypothetical protein
MLSISGSVIVIIIIIKVEKDSEGKEGEKIIIFNYHVKI